MNSINKYKFAKLLKILVIFVQIVFTFGFSYSQNTVEKCCHQEKKVKKHSCCMELESSPLFDHCNSVQNNGESEYTNCNCIHTIKSAGQETIVDKNYELSKIVIVTANNILSGSDLQFSTINVYQNFDYIHGPPIFLIDSSLLI